MKVTVTGGSGRLGCSLVRTLLEKGNTVRVLEHGSGIPESLKGLDVEYIYGSVLDKAVVEQAVAGAEVVYHLAAKIDLDRDLDGSVVAVNVEGTRNVAEVCLAADIRMVHTSSHHALVLQPLDQPLDESRELALDHVCFYHRSKAQGEKLVTDMVKQQGLNAVIINPGTITGPYDFEPSMLGQGLIDLAKGKLPALLNISSDCSDARDIADAMIVAADKGVAGERYLLTGEPVPMKQMAEIWSHISGCKVPKVFLPLWFGWLVIPFTIAAARLTGKKPLFTPNMLRASISNDTVDYSKSTKAFGYQPRSIQASLQDAYDFYHQQGWL